MFTAYKSTYSAFKRCKRKDLVRKLNVWWKEDYKKYMKYLPKPLKFKAFVFTNFRGLYNIVYRMKNKKRVK